MTPASIILYGSGTACLNAFLMRESATGRCLGPGHWIANNLDQYYRFSLPAYRPFRLDMFKDKKRIKVDELSSNSMQDFSRQLKSV